MMLTNPARDFFVKAVPIAKQNRITELNYIEAELIMMEEDILELKRREIIPDDGFLEQKIDELKDVVRSKRAELTK